MSVFNSSTQVGQFPQGVMVLTTQNRATFDNVRNVEIKPEAYAFTDQDGKTVAIYNPENLICIVTLPSTNMG